MFRMFGKETQKREDRQTKSSHRESWEEIPSTLCEKFDESMPNCLKANIGAKGGRTAF